MEFRSPTTLWISHSAISDFENCPKLYYLKNIYRSPLTNNRVQLVNPYLSLGTVVHETIEELATVPLEKRFAIPLLERFERLKHRHSGRKGGFANEQEQEKFWERARAMILRIENNQTIFRNPSLPLPGSFPKVQLFPDKDIILVGNIDWIEILPQNTLHIIDFKTGTKEESEDSLQLPIYFILARYNFTKDIEKTSYWYLEKEEGPRAVSLGPENGYIKLIRDKALRLKKAIDDGRFLCGSGSRSCFHCRDYEKIVWGRAEYVGYDQARNKDLYFCND